MKRVHSPVQCERCKEVFSIGNGRDRAQCMDELAKHREQEKSCELRDASLKEGVDQAQWAKLDKNNGRRNQEVHKVDKWFEIWDVLFPEVARPDNPWHEVLPQFGGTPKDGEEYFADLVLSIFNHKVHQGDIPLPDPAIFDWNMHRERLRTTVKTAFRTYVSMRESLSPETSSNESLHRRSLLSGSSAHRSSLGTTASHPTSAPTAATSCREVKKGSEREKGWKKSLQF
ncbi:hypothetical protein N0V88_008022 [Collariella sp. IMI 366227]|nr:hypothetical protein N0V88_008022 [Collariella sp. IMI 366227]